MTNLSFHTSELCKKSTFIHKNTFKTIIKFAGNKDELKNLILIRNNLNKHTKLSNQSIKNKFKYYNSSDPSAFKNTLSYLFYKIGFGIFVKILNNKLVMFYPFYNLSYKNNYNIKFNNASSFQEYVKRKRPDSYNYKVNTWSSNGCIVNNWKIDNINDGRWSEFYDMIFTLCKNEKIKDTEFFINYKDFPVINRKLYEPNFFMFDNTKHKMKECKFNAYLPILSCYSSKLYADIMIPSYTEWKMITKKYYPSNTKFSCENNQISIKKIKWSDKISTALFRGSATGCGITPLTNQRLRISELSNNWYSNNEYNQHNKIDHTPFLNAGIVGYNMRDKKDFNKPMDVINIKKLNIQRSNYLTRDQQQQFKYIVYIDGHVAAERLITELNSGSVILKVDSLYNWEQWFHYLLKPNIHYIPVKSDLSDLADKIRWCKTHDNECYQITQNAIKLYNEINNKNYILKYLKNHIIN